MGLSITVIACALNEERTIGACLHSVLAQVRPPDEIIVVDNGSADATARVAATVPGVRVVTEPARGLVRARAAGLSAARGDVLAYLDADCRAPLHWLERLEQCFVRDGNVVAVTGPYRFYDWDLIGRGLVRAYDVLVAPPVHAVLQRVLGAGAILYGGNFAVRRSALDAIGGFDTSIEFHGEDTNLGRRLARVGHVELARACWLHTSARRYRALGRGYVFRLYVRNFWSEIRHHRPADGTHVDVRR